ncbi:MAG: response regulator transcription factor [Clostridioides sp.]|jgi:two-component system response regulator VanR|nr:response regulator transcription factor [Clostridioides sp.]
MSNRILIVEDETSIAEFIEVYLKNEDFEVYKCITAEEALKIIDTKEFDLVLLDIMLPGKDGFFLCKKIREEYKYPIIMLTSISDEASKINGLALGADDYITKPFLPLEMVARVKAQLRRYKKYAQTDDKGNASILSYSGLELNIKTRECSLNGNQLNLTPSEYDILRLLLEHKGEVVSSEQLFKTIWHDEYYSKNNTISVHVRHLREKLGDKAENPKYIKTVWG